MKQIQFSIEIQSSKENIWKTLWDDRTFCIWANFIDEGTYMVGELTQGKNVQFISSSSGYGVTSYIEKVVHGEYVLFKHMMDTMDSGSNTREAEWTGGSESYSLVERDGITVLLVISDIPEEYVEMFGVSYPKALECIRSLAEG
jgi:hypothetical protein